jgi:hypothetical protein
VRSKTGRLLGSIDDSPFRTGGLSVLIDHVG